MDDAVVPMSEVALSRTTGKPGTGGSTTVLPAPFRPTSRTSKPPGDDHGDLAHMVWTTNLDIPVIELGPGQVNGTAPMPALILVVRLTCQRPSRRTSPILVEISSGSRRRHGQSTFR